MSARKKQLKAPAKRVSAGRTQSSPLATAGDFAALVERVIAIIEEARSRVVRTVNSEKPAEPKRPPRAKGRKK